MSSTGGRSMASRKCLGPDALCGKKFSCSSNSCTECFLVIASEEVDTEVPVPLARPVGPAGGSDTEPSSPKEACSKKHFNKTCLLFFAMWFHPQ